MYTFQGWHIPDRMMPGLKRWIEHGTLPGDFLQAVLSNNFMEICGRADEENLQNLPAYAGYLYNKAPSDCWGSEEQMRHWIETKKKQLQATEI